jgi:sigma-B regulation protein RsbU (phosphoserine phosphatase)
MRSGPVDLVLLDIMMPEMNGYEVLEHLKADRELRDVPVIVISALDEMDSVIKCIELGAEDYLAKPFNPTLLRARVGASLEKKQLRDEVRAGRDRLRRNSTLPDAQLGGCPPFLRGPRNIRSRSCPRRTGAPVSESYGLLGLSAPVLLSGRRRLRKGAPAAMFMARAKPSENGYRYSRNDDRGSRQRRSPRRR